MRQLTGMVSDLTAQVARLTALVEAGVTRAGGAAPGGGAPGGVELAALHRSPGGGSA